MGDTQSLNSQLRMKVCPVCRSRFDADGKVCPKDGTILVYEADELQAGSMIAGKYKVIGLIGRGASGSVYKAHQEGMNRDVAIKLLKLDFVSDDESLKRFELEAKATAKLRHKNVAAVYDHGRLPTGQPYMICEYLSGKTLRDVLKRHKLFSAEDAIEICAQICDAIGAAHEQGIVHRDIKPANIMLCVDENGHAIVKLIDFGMAKILRGQKGNTMTLGLTQTGDILGTPYYMSPEQALGQPVDWRADIYALGCVLFEMVSGSVPYHGASEYEVIDKHVYGPLPALPPHIVVPEQIPSVIKRCLAKTPDLRYSSTDEMKQELLGKAASVVKAPGSGLRSMTSSQTLPAAPKRSGMSPLVPLLLLIIVASIGIYILCIAQGWIQSPLAH